MRTPLSILSRLGLEISGLTGFLPGRLDESDHGRRIGFYTLITTIVVISALVAERLSKSGIIVGVCGAMLVGLVLVYIYWTHSLAADLEEPVKVPFQGRLRGEVFAPFGVAKPLLLSAPSGEELWVLAGPDDLEKIHRAQRANSYLQVTGRCWMHTRLISDLDGCQVQAKEAARARSQLASLPGAA